MSAELAAPAPAPHRPPVWARLLLVPVVAGITVLGLWVAGGGSRTTSAPRWG